MATKISKAKVIEGIKAKLAVLRASLAANDMIPVDRGYLNQVIAFRQERERELVKQLAAYRAITVQFKAVARKPKVLLKDVRNLPPINSWDRWHDESKFTLKDSDYLKRSIERLESALAALDCVLGDEISSEFGRRLNLEELL